MTRNSVLRILLCAGFMAAPLFSYAAIIGPYTPDSNTLHLYHLDEAAGGVFSADAVGTSPINLEAVSAGALGSSSLSGYGNSVNLTGGASGAFAKAPATGNADNLPVSSFVGSDGAFTFEAVVRMGIDPSMTTTNTYMEIISMERDSGSPRPFGFLYSQSNDYFSVGGAPTLTFYRSGGSEANTFKAALPSAGEDAPILDGWYHAALTYSGDETATNNLKFYWTRMDGTSTPDIANLIGTATLDADMTGDGAFVIGNEARGAPGEPWIGKMDEVRISGVARSESDMQFAPVPEPSGIVLAAFLGAMGLFIRSRKG